MILLLIFAIVICIILLSVVGFLFFNKEKSKHQIVLQQIQETINNQQNISLQQKSQLQHLQNSAELTEKTMEKVAAVFQEISVSEHEFLEKHIENLAAFSENSVDLIKIYGRFVKVVS